MNKERRKILILDDEAKIIEVVESFLGSRGFTVFGARTAERAFDIFERTRPDLILLDLMLPGMTGEEFCAAIRKKSHIPIIMLTAKSDEENMLNGLAAGADDYMTKPFSLKTLLARVEAALRRSSEYIGAPGNRLVFDGGALLIDLDRRVVVKNGEAVTLTPSEFGILAVLSKNPGTVFTRERLIDLALGGSAFDGFERAVDSHIKNLRQKIETIPKKPEYLLTAHGFGYQFGERRGGRRNEN